MITDYLDFTDSLFPLRPFELNNPDSKLPLEKGWRTRKYESLELQYFVDAGHGIGWRLGPYDLVIDIDVATPERPNKVGDKSFEKLVEAIGPLPETAQVTNPSGGSHLYLVNSSGEKLRKTLRAYPDIDFMRDGGFVVIAGSPHWQGGFYEFCPLSPKRRAIAPDSLIDLLKYKKPAERSDNNAQATITPEQLKGYLDQLDPLDFANNDDWFRVMAAAHSGTDGAGLEVFTNWSLQDEAYAGHREIIATRWESLNGHENPITMATIVGEISNRGGRVSIASSRAKDDFCPVDESGQEIVERFRVLDGDDIEDYREAVEFFVNGVMLKGQPLIIGGPEKSFKTTVMLDLAVSLATGTPFLNHFETPTPANVLVMSGETSVSTITRNARSVRNFKGLKRLPKNSMKLVGDVPFVDNIAELKILKKLIEKHETEVLIIDPTYFAITADQSSLSAVGEILRKLNRFCAKTGVTPVMAHHTKRGTKQTYDDLGVDALTGPGYSAWAAQWIMMNLREKYDYQSATAKLSATIGGRGFDGRIIQFQLNEGRKRGDPLFYDYSVKVTGDTGDFLDEFETADARAITALDAAPGRFLARAALAESIGLFELSPEFIAVTQGLIDSRRIMGDHVDGVDGFRLKDFEGAELF